MGRRIVVRGMLLLALLGVPRASDAGLIELIWEMSGPQMIGSGISCLYSVRLQRQECRIGGMFLRPTADQPKNPHGPFLVIGGSGFVSTSKNSDTQDYGWFDANMVALEPGVTIFSKLASPSNGVRIAHGTGVTYGLLFGENFRRFDKFGFSIVPIEVSYKKIVVAAKIRIYPNGFTDDEFGFGPRLSFNRPAEATYGFSFSYIYR